MRALEHLQDGWRDPGGAQLSGHSGHCLRRQHRAGRALRRHRRLGQIRHEVPSCRQRLGVEFRLRAPYGHRDLQSRRRGALGRPRRIFRRHRPDRRGLRHQRGLFRGARTARPRSARSAGPDGRHGVPLFRLQHHGPDQHVQIRGAVRADRGCPCTLFLRPRGPRAQSHRVVRGALIRAGRCRGRRSLRGLRTHRLEGRVQEYRRDGRAIRFGAPVRVRPVRPGDRGKQRAHARDRQDLVFRIDVHSDGVSGVHRERRLLPHPARRSDWQLPLRRHLERMPSGQ